MLLAACAVHTSTVIIPPAYFVFALIQNAVDVGVYCAVVSLCLCVRYKLYGVLCTYTTARITALTHTHMHARTHTCTRVHAAERDNTTVYYVQVSIRGRLFYLVHTTGPQAQTASQPGGD